MKGFVVAAVLLVVFLHNTGLSVVDLETLQT